METVNQEEKTFTQAELDSIIADRLTRERAKFADYDTLKDKAAKYDEAEQANKTELQKATEKVTELQQELDGMKAAKALQEMRDKVAKETGIPSNLLTAGTEEDCKAQAEAIKAFKESGAPKYPNVKDKGEIRGNVKTSTRQQFAEWFNSMQS